MLKLYISPGACATAAHVALEEVGVEYTTEVIDLGKGEQKSEAYLAINGAGETPALVTDRGVITQNSAILAYLAETVPGQTVAPAHDPFAMAQFNAFNGFLTSRLHPSIGTLLFANPPLVGEARDNAVKYALSKLQIVEDRLAIGPWVFGNSFTLSDGFLMVFERWAKRAGILDTGRFPKLNEHLDRVQKREAVGRVLASEGLQPI